MAVWPVTYYEVHCDAPECTVDTASVGSEFSAWKQESEALTEWTDADGVADSRGRTFCAEHRSLATGPDEES